MRTLLLFVILSVAKNLLKGYSQLSFVGCAMRTYYL